MTSPTFDADQIAILCAHSSDFPTLARIAAEAMSVDLIHRVMYPSTNVLDSRQQESRIIEELKRSASSPTSDQPKVHIWKAVPREEAETDLESEAVATKDTGKILGWVLFRVYEARDETATANSIITSGVPEASKANPRENPHKQTANATRESNPQASNHPQSTSRAFLSRISGEFKMAVAENLGSKPYIHCNFLMVRPGQQGRGIGSQMMRYGFEKLGADTLPCLVITQARLHEWYQKLDFEDVHVVDVDLAEYMGKYKGFGIHRSNVMVRPPNRKFLDMTGEAM